MYYSNGRRSEVGHRTLEGTEVARSESACHQVDGAEGGGDKEWARDRQR